MLKIKKKIKPFDDLMDLSYLNSMWGSFKQWSHSLKSNTNYGCRKTSTENCATVTSYTDPYMSWRRRQSKYTTFNLCYLPVHCSNNYSFFVRVMEYTFKNKYSCWYRKSERNSRSIPSAYPGKKNKLNNLAFPLR